MTLIRWWGIFTSEQGRISSESPSVPTTLVNFLSFSLGAHLALFRNDVTTLHEAAQVTKTLGHCGRLRILSLLRPGPLSVCQIASVVRAPPSTVSGHLLELRRAGLVTEQRRGKWVYYRLADADPATAVLNSVLTSIEDDPTLRQDAALAAGLRGTSPAALCENFTPLERSTT
jgi:DNA-binding transcriptional ArsR family regulator